MKTWTPKQILQFRQKHSLSQPALGRLVGVTGNYIYIMEKGVKAPSTMLQLLLGYVEEDLKRKGVVNRGKVKRLIQKNR